MAAKAMTLPLRDPALCAGTTKKGRPCPHAANLGSKYCGIHRPPSPTFLKIQEDRELEHKTRERIMKALERSGVAVWTNPVGEGYAKSGHYMQWGLCEGSADLIGLVPPYGRFLSIEVKRPKGGRKGELQTKWAESIRLMKGVAGFARTVDEAMALANEARRLP